MIGELLEDKLIRREKGREEKNPEVSEIRKLFPTHKISQI